MYEIEKKFRFEAGHQLKYHDGGCRERHGHSYLLILTLRADKLISSGPKMNMVMDFGEISNAVQPMIEKYLDHHWLNDSLETDSPTAEYIAKWVFNYLKPKIPTLHSIGLCETESSKVVYQN